MYLGDSKRPKGQHIHSISPAAAPQGQLGDVVLPPSPGQQTGISIHRASYAWNASRKRRGVTQQLQMNHRFSKSPQPERRGSGCNAPPPPHPTLGWHKVWSPLLPEMCSLAPQRAGGSTPERQRRFVLDGNRQMARATERWAELSLRDDEEGG